MIRSHTFLLAMGVGLALGGCRDRAEPPGRTRDTVSAAASSTARPAVSARPDAPKLRIERRSVEGRGYRWFGPERAVFALTLERPSPKDSALLLCVAGTYTSPSDSVEGVVLIDGRVIQTTRQGWQGLLRIEAGRAHVERAAPRALAKPGLAELAKRGVSLVQGHLLVDGGKPTRLKPSPELYRRAMVAEAERTAIVESALPVTLAGFAQDLAQQGAKSALNLDMGGWDEGWYRDASGAIRALGHDRSATSRQSNWLLIRAAEREATR